MTKCFEFDWQNSKISRIVKDRENLETLKLKLRELYSKIKSTYRILSCINMNSDVPSIS